MAAINTRTFALLSNDELTPNGTRRRPRIVIVDHVRRPDTRDQLYARFKHERTATADPAAYSKAHLPATT